MKKKKNGRKRTSSVSAPPVRTPFLFGLCLIILTALVLGILANTEGISITVAGYHLDHTQSFYGVLILIALGLLAVFILKILRALRIGARRRAIGIDEIDEMKGAEFEQYFGQLLEDLGFSDVFITKGSGDQGVDVIAVLGTATFAFQCKRSARPVGNKAVQEIIAGITYYPECDLGVVVTNSYFTESAEDLAQMGRVGLLDRDALIGMIEERLDHIRYTSEEDLLWRC